MKILCVGDSWTSGYGVPKRAKSWPNKLGKLTGHSIDVSAQGGASNFHIVDFIKQNNLKKYDILIIGWSGVTRYYHAGTNIDFCYAEDYGLRDKFFETKTLIDLEKDFLYLNQEVDELCKINNIKKLIKFSVFGDFKYLWDEKFTDISFLDFLAKKQGHNFVNEIPFFEFDFFSDVNYKNTTTFAKKYFNKGWDKAIIERDDIRPGQYFLEYGHPNSAGHLAWAEYLKEFL